MILADSAIGATPSAHRSPLTTHFLPSLFRCSAGRLKYLTLTEANRVWMPDLFFSNEKEGHFHNIIMPNVYIRIFPNGSVLYSIRISLTLACPMNLKLYPLDRQVCSLRMASCKCTAIQVILAPFEHMEIRTTRKAAAF